VDVGSAVHVGEGTSVAVSVGGTAVYVGARDGVKVTGRGAELEQLVSNNDNNNSVRKVLRMVFQ
jgi:hypothetical protein